MAAAIEAVPAGLLAIATRAGSTITAWRRWESASLKGWRMDMDCTACPPAGQWPYNSEHHLLVVEVVERTPQSFSLLVLEDAA